MEANCEIRPTGQTVSGWDMSLPRRERIAKGRIKIPTYAVYLYGQPVVGGLLHREADAMLAEYAEHGHFKSRAGGHRHLMRLSKSLWNS